MLEKIKCQCLMVVACCWRFGSRTWGANGSARVCANCDHRAAPVSIKGSLSKILPSIKDPDLHKLIFI
jgi:hypothetical protein